MSVAADDPLAAVAQVTGGGWLVGGALRDRLLGRRTTDFDVVVPGDPVPVARSFARSVGGHAFLLSQDFGGWRVVARDRTWQLDVLPLHGATIEEDLRARDFTVNALAQPLETLRSPAPEGDGALIDPLGGIGDLHAGRLRAASEHAFAEDPLRVLRLARLACQLGFGAEERTLAAAQRQAGDLARVAPERVFAELKLIVVAEQALRGLELMDALRATEAVLPELAELRGIEQSHYHHLDVHGHTRAVLACAIELERSPAGVFGELGDPVRAVLDEPLANELTRGQALRFGALFHDIAKPLTRDVTPEGRVTFMGHDAAGAEIAAAALTRLRASDRLAEHVAALTRHHLRLGFLVHEMPLSRRAVYRYLKACGPVGVDVTVLSVADRLATRGRGSERAIAKHLELARQLMGEALAWRRRPPRPPVRGDELAQAAGVRPGPELGRVLAELEEASFAGEIDGRSAALERGRELLAAAPER
jgi:putative nucleotidyltransferase with HDIG domain